MLRSQSSTNLDILAPPNLFHLSGVSLLSRAGQGLAVMAWLTPPGMPVSTLSSPGKSLTCTLPRPSGQVGFQHPTALICSSLSHCPKRVQVSPLPLYVLFVTAGYCLPHQAHRVRIAHVYPQLSPHTRQVDSRISSIFRILGESR